jgi:hypothetical protein
MVTDFGGSLCDVGDAGLQLYAAGRLRVQLQPPHRSSLPTEDSARKLIYLAITGAQSKWRHADNWSAALLALRIHFADRIPDSAI